MDSITEPLTFAVEPDNGVRVARAVCGFIIARPSVAMVEATIRLRPVWSLTLK
jgi:hypothetical protein